MSITFNVHLLPEENIEVIWRNFIITIYHPTGMGADVLDLTGQNADTFGKLKEENTWFELTDAQKQYMDMVQNVNDYIKNEYHALHTFLWKSGYSGMGNTMPKR